MTIIHPLLVFISFVFLGCIRNETSSQLEIQSDTVFVDPNKAMKEDQVSSETVASIDLCRCLTEAGNSQWAVNNKEACDAAISSKLGVSDWGKVNFSNNQELNRKWDELVAACSGSSKVKIGVETIDKNNALIPEIGTANGFIWESVNSEAQLYTTLAFDDLVFRSTAYAMNGQRESENFTKIIDISGRWTVIDAQTAEGIIKSNNVPVTWTFSHDYMSLTNNKGVIFKRTKVE